MTMSATGPSSASAPLRLEIKPPPAAPACLRHPLVDGPAHCTACGGALCTACARSAAHRACPACAVAAGSAPWQVNAAWYLTLLVDAVSHAGLLLGRSLLPLLAAVAVGVAPMVTGQSLADYGGVFIDATVGAVLGVLMMSMLATPSRNAPAVITRLGRCVIIMVLPGLLAMVVAVPLTLVGSHFEVSVVTVGILGVVVAAVAALAPAMQGAAVMHRSVGAFPLRLVTGAGLGALGVVVVFALLQAVLGRLLGFPALMVVGFSSPLVTVVICIKQFLYATMALAAGRFLMDACATRAAPPHFPPA